MKRVLSILFSAQREFFGCLCAEQIDSKRLKFCKTVGGATRPGLLGAKAPSE